MDADSDAANITFILLSNEDRTVENSLGHILKQKDPVNTFSQKDLQQGSLFFAHHGEKKKFLAKTLESLKQINQF